VDISGGSVNGEKRQRECQLMPENEADIRSARQ